MSSISFSIAPDVSPQRLPGWHLFSSWLQRKTGEGISVLEYISFDDQKQALLDGKIDLLYANPYDAGWLIREQKFIALAQPASDVAEVTIVTKKGGDITKVEDLKTDLKVSAAMNADLRTLGTILLEPANLTKDDITFIDTSNHILAIKELLKGNSQVAMLPTDIYRGLSKIVASQLESLVATEPEDIATVAHCFVLSPAFAEKAELLKETLRTMHEDDNGKSVLEDLKVDHWKILDSEDDITFMIDLIYTLQI